MEKLPALMIPFQYRNRDVFVRIDSHGEPQFLLRDVSGPLGYSDAHSAARILDEDESELHDVRFSSQTRKMLFVTESGLYHLIFLSKKPAAQQFRRWVTKVLLPTIRKTGAFSFDGQNVMRTFQRPVHVDASNRINEHYGNLGGKAAAIGFNVGTCETHSRRNEAPKILKEGARDRGLPPQYRRSGVDVLRVEEPESAAAICVEKDLILQGVDPVVARQFAIAVRPQLEEARRLMIQLGIGHVPLLPDRR